jgi:hypothetical protein
MSLAIAGAVIAAAAIAGTLTLLSATNSPDVKRVTYKCFHFMQVACDAVNERSKAGA